MINKWLDRQEKSKSYSLRQRCSANSLALEKRIQSAGWFSSSSLALRSLLRQDAPFLFTCKLQACSTRGLGAGNTLNTFPNLRTSCFWRLPHLDHPVTYCDLGGQAGLWDGRHGGWSPAPVPLSWTCMVSPEVSPPGWVKTRASYRMEDGRAVLLLPIALLLPWAHSSLARRSLLASLCLSLNRARESPAGFVQKIRPSDANFAVLGGIWGTVLF